MQGQCRNAPKNQRTICNRKPSILFLDLEFASWLVIWMFHLTVLA
jgi:hypothetical protein